MADTCLVAGQPGTVAVIRVAWWWIGRSGHLKSVSVWKGAEVVVESVVLLDDDDNVLNLARGQAGRSVSRHARFGALERIYAL